MSATRRKRQQDFVSGCFYSLLLIRMRFSFLSVSQISFSLEQDIRSAQKLSRAVLNRSTALWLNRTLRYHRFCNSDEQDGIQKMQKQNKEHSDSRTSSM